MYIDLRSDTVTKPTAEMLAAMGNCPVGDDVYQDDPTVAKLERLAAEMTGKEASLFIPTGTMANQLAIMTHTNSGDEIILSETCHIVLHEVGAAAKLSGVSYAIVHNETGFIYKSDVEKAYRVEDIHFPPTGLLCLENALGSGVIVPLKIMEEAFTAAHKLGLPVHLDGARIFNAATYLGVDAKEISKYCDSLMFCISKGLCAPVGSMLCGTTEFINKARKNRKLLGGGMRQAGVLAACGIISLEKMTKRLGEDHANAMYMAKKLKDMPFIDVNLDNVQINMVFFAFKDGVVKSDEHFVNYLMKNHVKINGIEFGEYRFVTSNDVNKDDINKVMSLIEAYVK